MARFDLHRLGGRLVVDVQAQRASELETRIVIPLVPEGSIIPAERLHPAIEIGGDGYRLMPELMASMLKRDLGRRVGSLTAYHDEIVLAIDMVLSEI